ncbi:hypothetical protein [Candidatus Kuenenia sp.]|uniref:hypothetical protein n=1 Tax=Candidatus Kuenenia sp. TaxID=2499824 RepID=UPI003220382B
MTDSKIVPKKKNAFYHPKNGPERFNSDMFLPSIRRCLPYQGNFTISFGHIEHEKHDAKKFEEKSYPYIDSIQ